MLSTEVNFESLLTGHFLLRHLNPEELRRLAAGVKMIQCNVSKTIFHKGDPGRSMMLVMSGRVKICTYSDGGRELILDIIGEGGLFGETAFLDGEPRSADAVAIEDTLLAVLERSRFLTFLATNPEIQTRLIGVLCQKLRQTSEYLEDALLRDAPSRVARGLFRLLKSFGVQEAGGVVLKVKLSQQQIGSLVGLSRESINKNLGEWTRTGLVAVKDGCITILDRDALELIAASEI